mmetsp:Transcript_39526/g.72406  ORF Transcript_39526/g.72406 Transcript_39526/m.72406 type:complete len:317 (-) Transcript_39526:112-1062(-)
MTNTAAEDSERHQLLPSIAIYEDSEVSALKNRFQFKKSASGGDGGEEEIMAQSRSFLGPIAAVLAIPFLWLAFTGCVVVPPGELAVVVTLGRVDVYEPGPHFRTPFISTVHIMSTKMQLLSEKNNIPTKEGLTVSLDVALLYRIDPKMAGHLYQNVGLDYASVLIKPEAASVIRGFTSESDAKALYSSGRHKIQDAVKEELDKTLRKKGIIIENVMLKDLKLPESLSESIELKAQAEQESGRMEFVLTREKQEAERKAIEAQGIADFQRIVSQGISEQTLMWKGIEATEKLIDSPNAKIIMMGNSKGDLPVILNGN